MGIGPKVVCIQPVLAYSGWTTRLLIPVDTKKDCENCRIPTQNYLAKIAKLAIMFFMVEKIPNLI
jgi:hypothetical protein